MNRLTTFLNPKTDKLKFANLSTLAALVIGIYSSTIYFAAEHIYFFLSIPIATFFSCYFIWKWTFNAKNDYKAGNVFSIALILTIVIHYLNFAILGIARILCHMLSGGCAAYNGQTESLFGTLTFYSWLRMLISLYYLGLVTFILLFAIGMYVIKTSKLNNENS